MHRYLTIVHAISLSIHATVNNLIAGSFEPKGLCQLQQNSVADGEDLQIEMSCK